MRQGEEIIPVGCNVTVFYQSKMEMSVKRLLDICDILHLCYPSDADLLPFIQICLWLLCHGAIFLEKSMKIAK